jgi:hypothetical protein
MESRWDSGHRPEAVAPAELSLVVTAMQLNSRTALCNPEGIESFSPGLVARATYPGLADENGATTLKRVGSVPHIPLVELNFVASEERPKLVLK